MHYKSITAMVLAPVLLSLFVLVSLTSISLYKTYWLLDQFETLERTVVNAERDVTESLNDFKTQVQEWKNVLLRGHDTDDREKYWQRFLDKEAAIQTALNSMLSDEAIDNDAKQLLRDFLSAHQNMANSYRQGYQAFIDSEFDHKLGDAAVRGIDREPAKLLADLSANIAANAKQSLESLKASMRTTLLIVLCSLIAIFFLTLFYVTKRLRSQIIKPVKSIAERIDGLANADYQHDLKYLSENELGNLANATRVLQKKLVNSVDSLLEAEVHVTAANETLDGVSRDIHSGSVEQSNATVSLGQSTDLLKGSVEHLVNISSQVSTVSEQSSENINVCFKTFDAANEGFTELAGTVTHSSEIVEALQSRSSDILGVVNVINEIADQTNLLALNAAIEAARAGEHGRGFAVVADEVRALAAKTQQSTKEINKILSAFETEADSAVTAMQKGKDLSDHSAAESHSALKKLKEVVSGVATMREAVDSLNQVTTQQTGVVEQVADVTQRIVALADQYRSLSERQDITQHMRDATHQVDSVVEALTQN